MEVKDFYDSDAAVQMAAAYNAPAKRQSDLLLLFILLFSAFAL